MISKLRKRNPTLYVGTADDPSFKKYGRLVTGYDYGPIIEYLEKQTPMPDSGNAYVPDLEDTHSMEIFEGLQNACFGSMPIQIGYCNGHNTQLNALEYHKCSEVDIAATDCMLLLASLSDLEDGKLDSRKIHGYYIFKGQAVELYGPTLHFAPCEVASGGYRTAIVLGKGTNLPIEAKDPREPMQRMTNKWLIAHPDCERFATSGAYLGITGENIRVYY
jgi:hypothetical protein